jgi:hypothetical protein
LTDKQIFRLKLFLDHVAIASSRHLLDELPQSLRKSEEFKASGIQDEHAVLVALANLKKALTERSVELGESEEMADLRAEFVGLAVIGAIGEERPTDLKTLRIFFSMVKPSVAKSLKAVVLGEQPAALLQIAGELADVEVAAPEVIKAHFKAMNHVEKAAVFAGFISAASTGLFAMYELDRAHFGEHLESMMKNAWTILVNHHSDSSNHYRRSISQEYMLGMKLIIDQMRGYLVAAGLMAPVAQHPVIAKHGYLPKACRDLFGRAPMGMAPLLSSSY